MKTKSLNIIKIFAVFLTLNTLLSCSLINKENDSIKTFYSDTSLFQLDTFFNDVLIDGKRFQLSVYVDKKDENLVNYEEIEEGPITLLLSNFDDGKVVFLKKLEERGYLNIQLYKVNSDSPNSEGRLYLDVTSHAGGSGLNFTVYYFYLRNNLPSLTPIFEGNELTYVLHNKNDKELLALNGIWDDFNESHFDNHRFLITIYDYENGFNKYNIGVTRYKYESLSSGEDVLYDIKKREPNLLNEIDINDYVGN